MVDIVSKEIRSKMMSGIRSRDTKPELFVRKYLHARGFRYSLRKRPDLPCQPDLVLSKYRAAIFVHGCFWHRHEGCRFATVPKTDEERWKRKFARNVERDANCQLALELEGWRTATVWECVLRSAGEVRMEALVEWLVRGDLEHLELGF